MTTMTSKLGLNLQKLMKEMFMVSEPVPEPITHEAGQEKTSPEREQANLT